MASKGKINLLASGLIIVAGTVGGLYGLTYAVGKIGTAVNTKKLGNTVFVQDLTPALTHIMYYVDVGPCVLGGCVLEECHLQTQRSFSDKIELHDESCNGSIETAKVNGKEILRTSDEKLFEKLDKKYSDTVKNYNLMNRAADLWEEGLFSEVEARKKLEHLVK